MSPHMDPDIFHMLFHVLLIFKIMSDDFDKSPATVQPPEILTPFLQKYPVELFF